MAVIQPGSKMCFVCGSINPIGLKVHFHSEGDTCWTEFTPGDEHQSWPGQLHGGIISALLDETMGRSPYPRDIWTFTARLEIRFRKPVPLGEPVKVIGKVERVRGKLVECSGEVQLADGSIAAEATGSFIRVPEDRLNEVKQILEMQ